MDRVQAYRERRMKRILSRFDCLEEPSTPDKVSAYRERRRRRLAECGIVDYFSINPENILTLKPKCGIIKSSGKTARKDGEPAFNRAVIAKALDAGIPNKRPTPREAIDYLTENHISTNEAINDWTDKWLSKNAVKSEKKKSQEEREEENKKYGGREKKKKAVAEKEKEERKKKRQEAREAELIKNIGTRDNPASMGANPDCAPFKEDNLEDHWNGNAGAGVHSHKQEAMNFGLKDKYEYADFARELLKCPCTVNAGSFKKSNGIVVNFNVKGFMRDDKMLVRYDLTSGWIVVGDPKTGPYTCFPTTIEYFENEKRARWDKNYPC